MTNDGRLHLCFAPVAAIKTDGACRLTWHTGMLLAALVFSGAVHAGDTALSCSAPTKLVDGRDIPATGPESLSGYLFEYGTCNGTPPNYSFGTKQGERSSPICETVFAAQPPGTYCYVVSAVQVNGDKSSRSNAASKVVPPSPPLPPPSLIVTNTTAYQALQTKDSFVFLPVGTVPGDTTCNAQQTANGYYSVPRDAVTWFGSVRPQLVFARCT